jgi:hypothetical protein
MPKRRKPRELLKVYLQQFTALALTQGASVLNLSRKQKLSGGLSRATKE